MASKSSKVVEPKSPSSMNPTVSSKEKVVLPTISGSPSGGVTPLKSLTVKRGDDGASGHSRRLSTDEGQPPEKSHRRRSSSNAAPPSYSPVSSPRMIGKSTDEYTIPDDHPPLPKGSSGGMGGCPVFSIPVDDNDDWRARKDSERKDDISDTKSSSSKRSKGSKKKGDTASQSSDDQEWGVGATNNLNLLFQHEVDSDDESDSNSSHQSYESMDNAALRREIKLLHRINNFTRDIAENSNQAIVVVEAESKKIYWVNGRAQVMFGKLVDDLIDQNVNILLPTEIAKKHDKYIDSYISAWQKEKMPPDSKVVNPRTPREIKAVRYNSDGSKTLFTAEMFVRYMKINGRNDKPPKLFMAYINDITEVKALKHQLSVSKVIQQKSNEAIVVCDLYGKILSCNHVCEQMFGTSLSFLLAHNKNIKWFMPKNIAEKHDGYLSGFRDNLKTGYDLQKSTIIGKSRNMKGRRPGDKDDELFSIVLRVELVEEELVAYIRDVSDTITRDEFNSALVSKVFPKCIKNKVLRVDERQVDAYEICEHLTNKTIVYTDLENFTKYSNGTEVSDVYKHVNAMYKAFDVLIPQFAGEMVKRTGDGVIAIFGLVGNAKKHSDRAIYCAISMMHWAEENGYKMRIGIATGDVGSGIFGDGESRPQWDVLGESVNYASRMQTYGQVNKVHISETSYNSITDSRLHPLFDKRSVDGVKGYGTVTSYLSRDFDFFDLAPLMQRRIFEVDHERRRILEREKRLEELEGLHTIQKTDDY